MTNLSDPVVASIVTARVSLLFNSPFFGNLATRLKLVDASAWCKTAAVDGRHLFYNREFIKSLTPDELIFLIGHEVLHCVFDHIGRRGSRHPKLWNIANDYIVNYTLVKQKIGTMPKVGLYSDKYTDEMTSEEVYKLLYDELEKNAKFADKMDTLDQHLECDGSDEGDGEGKSKSGDGDGEGGKADGDPDPGSETGVDYGRTPPVYNEADLEKIRNEVKAAVINSAQVNTGNLPGCVARMIQQLTSPTISWRELLTTSIQSCIKDDYSFNQPNRRSWHMGVIMPSQKNMETIDICVSLDTSGSIGDDKFRAFLSEVKGIMEQYQDYRLHIWCIDAAIYNHQVFTPENASEIDTYKPFGGGGNDFPLNWSYMREQELQPELFVVFSDGYPCGSWGDPDYCDTIFVILNEWDKKIEAPFGRTVYMED